MDKDRYTGHTKILVPLERDADGYPPVAVEGLWAVPAEDGHFKIDNIPFFARGLSCGDIISVYEKEGEIWVADLIRPSANSTLRIIVLDTARIEEVRTKVGQFGCSWEGSHLVSLFSVNVSPAADIEGLFAYLEAAEDQELLSYEVAAYRS